MKDHISKSTGVHGVDILLLTTGLQTQKVATGKSQTITTSVVLTLRSKDMKRVSNPVIPNYTPRNERAKEEEPVLTFTPCCVCNKKILEGPYGRWIDGNTCCKTCEAIKEAQPRNFGE